MFHRLVAPTYFNIPSFDYMNNGGGGTPALADGPRPAGPNAGTRFVGFAEDATSAAVNRGLHALSENTDYLDDLLHRDLAVPRRTPDQVAGAPVSSITLSGPVFVGDVGTPNTPEGIRSFVQIANDSDGDLYNGGSECIVTSISGATPGDVWSVGNIDITISPAIPIGATYRVYYSARKSAAEFLPGDIVVRRQPSSRFEGGAPWLDTTPNPANSLNSQLNKIVLDLTAVQGAARVGAAAQAGSTFSLIDGSIQDQLTSLLGDANTLSAGLSAEITARTLVADTPLATVAALTAIPAPSDKLVREVIGSGVYVFDASSVASDYGSFVLPPDDLTPGKWINSINSLRDVATGLATLNGSSQLRVLSTGWPTFVAGNRYRIRMVGAHGVMITNGNSSAITDPTTAFFTSFYAHISGDGLIDLSRGSQLQFLLTPTSGATVGTQICLDPYVHNGATITQIEIRVTPGTGRAALPSHPWSVGIFRKGPTYTNNLESLFSSYLAPDTQLTLSDYQTQHTATFTCDQNNVVDTEQYTYYLQIWNEWGTNVHSGVKIEAIQLTLDNIADMRFP